MCRDGDKRKTGTGRTNRKRGGRVGWDRVTTARIRVTEGLGSAMLSIWLRDVLCFGTVLHEHRDYTPYIHRVGLSLPPGGQNGPHQTDTELITALPLPRP